MKFYEIDSDFKNESYYLLLEWAKVEASSFSLIWRKGFSFAATAQEVEKRLRPYLIKEELTNEWPGTKICAPPEETIRFYRITNDTIKVLRTVTSVYDWLAPDYPEDLAFYNKECCPLFGSVAHEHLSFLFGNDSIVATAKKKIPEIAIYLS
ncbi:hypothetical protein FY034_00610 [Trichlorobacter lovleyi]|uniref:hypothetical protein n=1 Tax=Trichlorobacter lovleyi TaxID=313985 RepID=UPI00223F95F7|nr:hypothetical protein [Trichlorobacter lovleyi]QOX77503.1 hypothetical protein FY034_00610 [Trichlorobacter lovleyi]